MRSACITTNNTAERRTAGERHWNDIALNYVDLLCFAFCCHFVLMKFLFGLLLLFSRFSYFTSFWSCKNTYVAVFSLHLWLGRVPNVCACVWWRSAWNAFRIVLTLFVSSINCCSSFGDGECICSRDACTRWVENDERERKKMQILVTDLCFYAFPPCEMRRRIGRPPNKRRMCSMNESVA